MVGFLFKGLIGFSFLLHLLAKHQHWLLRHKTKKKVGFFQSPQSLKFLICFLLIQHGWVFFVVCKKVAKAFDLFCIWILLFQSYHGLEKAICLLHWKLFVDLHCWCFLTGMMILSLIIPHFSLAHVSGVCGMNNKSVIEMMSERRCHYYVFGSLLQSYHGLEAIWLLHWKLFGDLHC